MSFSPFYKGVEEKGKKQKIKEKTIVPSSSVQQFWRLP